MDNCRVLYHFTRKDKLRSILSSNTLKVSERTGLRAVSLTRDKNLIKRCLWLKTNKINACLVLDGTKLSHNYKIEPFDFFSRYPLHGRWYKEAEELVRRDITDLDKYIIGVIKY